MTWIILIIQISFKKNHVGVLSLNGYDLREWTENLLNSSIRLDLSAKRYYFVALN